MIAHLLRFDVPLIVVTGVLLALFNPQPQWWQVSIIMIGAAVWDWGWHSKIHHPQIWSANPLIRIGGAAATFAVPFL